MFEMIVLIIMITICKRVKVEIKIKSFTVCYEIYHRRLGSRSKSDTVRVACRFSKLGQNCQIVLTGF